MQWGLAHFKITPFTSLLVTFGITVMLESLIFDPVSDGKHVILIMLIVGLIFVAVIGLGELTHRVGERRRERKRQLRSY